MSWFLRFCVKITQKVVSQLLSSPLFFCSKIYLLAFMPIVFFFYIGSYLSLFFFSVLCKIVNLYTQLVYVLVYNLLLIILTVCHLTGWSSTPWLGRYCSLPCSACPASCLTIYFNGAYEASWSKIISSVFVCHTFFIIFWRWQLLKGILGQTDPSQKNSLLVLKFLPLMIGYFSLSVPSGLSIYWSVSKSLFHFPI